ncbi:alpha/beta hydrolase [Candidatus Accumulibacter sp. ACC003]|uniref:lipase family alpha/beta hydrolase n=1 Tax=Candidatus Accumulibacter sp. ACC003 TaxID=2823334 RepID=UPI0025C0AAD9|nr:alpha/beta hydrolase [Candidatus Accumulibacter sp. ACC003]
MPGDQTKSSAPLARTGYSDAAKTAVQQTARRVQEMHSAIADTYFDILSRIPLLSAPAQLVRSAHDTIAAGVYGAIHHGSGGLLAAASLVEKRGSGRPPGKPPGRLATGLRSALNGAFGDHLAASNNVLAVPMAIYVDGAAIALDAATLRGAFPDAGKRLCVFVHGLGCDEHSWDADDRASTAQCHFGRQLHADFACTPVYLRYNSGLPIVRNGAQLAAILEELLAAWPQPASELLLIAHSMGGLVALSACEHAAAAAMHWPQSTRMLICLGSPNLGSPVERLGHLTNTALNVSKITAPLGKIAAARSQGIKDLRHGPGAPSRDPAHEHIAFRFLGSSLAADSTYRVGNVFGDGMVTLGSATAHAIDGDVQCASVGKLGHLRMLTDARVYRQISDWVGALEPPLQQEIP